MEIDREKNQFTLSQEEMRILGQETKATFPFNEAETMLQQAKNALERYIDLQPPALNAQKNKITHMKLAAERCLSALIRQLEGIDNPPSATDEIEDWLKRQENNP